MAYAIRTVECEDCHRSMTGRYKPSPPWRCFECSVKFMIAYNTAQHDPAAPIQHPGAERAAEQVRQMRAKHGEHYDRYRAGLLASLPPSPLLPESPGQDPEPG